VKARLRLTPHRPKRWVRDEKVEYVHIKREQFAEEFLHNCIEKARDLYGLTEEEVKKLLREMGY